MKYYPELKFLKSLVFALVLLCPVAGFPQLLEEASGWDEETAINHSQAAVGRQLGDFTFRKTDGAEVSLSDYAGKPLLISLIFTSCHHVCPTTTKRLADAVRAAKDVLGVDTFNVLTIGFDTVNDTPEAMRQFARAQSVADDSWEFLSTDFETVDALAAELGFIYFRTARGFDHITQVSVINRDMTVYQQVYGVHFELPWLVEPLKDLVYNRHGIAKNPVSGLLNRIRLFCTTYDPARDAYHFDFSLFIQMAIGFLSVFGVGWYLVKEMRRGRAS